MRKIFVIATLFLGILSGQAQEKVIKVLKKDGTTTVAKTPSFSQSIGERNRRRNTGRRRSGSVGENAEWRYLSRTL